MYRGIKSKLSYKALFLLGVYVLHFTFFQHFAAHFSDSQSSVKTFFPASHEKSNSNSSLTIFRILEKHEVSKKIIILHSDITESFSLGSNCTFRPLVNLSKQAIDHYSFDRSDASYRLYLKDRVFRI